MQSTDANSQTNSPAQGTALSSGPSSALSVAVAGATGYAGAEILRLLLGHPAYAAGTLTIGALTAHSNAGQSVGELMPHLPQLADRVITETTVDNLAGHDVVFLALPHGHSAAIGSELGVDVTVIDCAADFRLRNQADWEEFYGGDWAGSWAYGIPELPGNRAQLSGARRVAVPGCFPTAISLAAAPAVRAGLIVPELTAVAVTGVSGAGKKAQVALLGAETMSNARAYSPGGTHRHTPEIIQNLQALTEEDVHVSFTPVLVPMPRGILATVTAPLKPDVALDGGVGDSGVGDGGVGDGDAGSARVREAFAQFYEGEPFCVLLPEGQQPETHNVVGSNVAQVQVHIDKRARQLVMTCAIDNLTKGTAGAAVQCMNLALGMAETAGLPRAGLAP